MDLHASRDRSVATKYSALYTFHDICRRLTCPVTASQKITSDVVAFTSDVLAYSLFTIHAFTSDVFAFTSDVFALIQPISARDFDVFGSHFDVDKCTDR